MDKSPPKQRWYQRRRTDPGHLPDDAADVGTAFGLEMSLGGLPPVAEQPARPQDTVKPGWTQRVMGRSRTR